MNLRPRRDSIGELELGTRIGRYVLLERLGVGGMGWVFLAFDPQLDRKVALKLLREDRKLSKLGSRLAREAQALARVTHPNVVAVYDVGTWDDRSFVTMEYVQGTTLTAWLARPHTIAEVIEMFGAAGRGLAAAHAAGLVHRDFKPDNVLVGDDGRARVVDFGLVRANVGDHDDPVDPGPQTLGLDELDDETAFDTGHSSPLDTPLTRVGALLGTPRYMAPEQILRRSADARTDQFSFCMVLYEALWGLRPFTGVDSTSMMQGVLHRDRTPRPSERKVPGWLDAIVERGLNHDPEQRWPSMDALLAALADDPSKRRRRVLAGGVALAGLVALIGTPLAIEQQRSEARRAACEAGDDSPVATWTPERAHALEEAFVAAGTPGAASSWTATRRWLDAYAERLDMLRRDNCLARDVEGSRSAAEAEAVDACLVDAGASFTALVEVLGEGHEGLLLHAARAATTLPLLDECSDVQRQLALVRPPEPLRERQAALMLRIDRARALRLIEAFDAAERVLDEAERDARELDWAPLLARTHQQRAALLYARGELVAARERAELAFRAAAVADDTNTMFESAYIVASTSLRGGDVERAESWIDTSAALLRGGELESSLQAAQLDVLRAHAATTRGEFVASEAFARAAIARTEALLGPEHPELSWGLNQLGTALHEQKRYEESRRVNERELAIVSGAFGPDSPALLIAYTNIGASLQVAGEADEARDYYERGLEIADRGIGLDHFLVGSPIANLGLLAFDAGELEPARTYFGQALKIVESNEGPDSPTLLRLLVNLGTIASRQGRHDDALAYFARSVALLERIQAAEHDPRETWIRASYADAYLRKAEPGPAEPLYRRALEVAEALKGATDAQTIRPRIGLASVAIERGDLEQAEAELAHAAAIIDAEPTRRWALDFARARLTWARGDHEGAIRALASIRASQLAHPDSHYAVADIDAWIAAHEAP